MMAIEQIKNSLVFLRRDQVLDFCMQFHRRWQWYRRKESRHESMEMNMISEDHVHYELYLVFEPQSKSKSKSASRVAIWPASSTDGRSCKFKLSSFQMIHTYWLKETGLVQQSSNEVALFLRTNERRLVCKKRRERPMSMDGERLQSNPERSTWVN